MEGNVCLPVAVSLPRPTFDSAECHTCDEENNPCQNDGYCQVVDGACNYQCSCKVGFTGTDCDVVVDVCADASCPSGTQCVPHDSAARGYACDQVSRVRMLSIDSSNAHLFGLDNASRRRLDNAPGTFLCCAPLVAL